MQDPDTEILDTGGLSLFRQFEKEGTREVAEWQRKQGLDWEASRVGRAASMLLL